MARSPALLVIGGTGELGRGTVDAARAAAAARDDVRVAATYCHTSPPPRTSTGGTLHNGVDFAWRRLDASDHAATAALIESVSPTAVVYCAVPKHGGAAGKGGEAVRRGIVDDVVAAARATSCASRPCRFIAISTDQVFDGRPPGHAPYAPADARRPTNPYATYKCEMEDALVALRHPDLVIARTSLILSMARTSGGDDDEEEHDGKAIAFCRRVLNSTDAEPVALFTDEPRHMSWAEDLGAALVEAALAERYDRAEALTSLATEPPDARHVARSGRRAERDGRAGAMVLHLASARATNRYELTRMLAVRRWGVSEEAFSRCRVRPGLSAESGTHRPLDLRMDVSLARRCGLVTRTHLRGVDEYLVGE